MPVVPTEIVTGEADIIAFIINVDVDDFLILTDVEVRGLNQFPAERIFSQFLCGVVVDVHKSNVVLNIRAALVKDNFLEKLCDLFVGNHIFFLSVTAFHHLIGNGVIDEHTGIVVEEIQSVQITVERFHHLIVAVINFVSHISSSFLQYKDNHFILIIGTCGATRATPKWLCGHRGKVFVRNLVHFVAERQIVFRFVSWIPTIPIVCIFEHFRSDATIPPCNVLDIKNIIVVGDTAVISDDNLLAVQGYLNRHMVAVVTVDCVVEVMLVDKAIRLKQNGSIFDAELAQYLGKDECGEATPSTEQILFGYELIDLVGKFPNQ